jgi:hypothetical protein
MKTVPASESADDEDTTKVFIRGAVNSAGTPSVMLLTGGRDGRTGAQTGG